MRVYAHRPCFLVKRRVCIISGKAASAFAPESRGRAQGHVPIAVHAWTVAVMLSIASPVGANAPASQ